MGNGGWRVGSRLTAQDQNHVAPVSGGEGYLIWSEQPWLTRTSRDRGGGTWLLGEGGRAKGVHRELRPKVIGMPVLGARGRGGGGSGGHVTVADGWAGGEGPWGNRGRW